jgi:uncharacterized membrane protein YpjA
MRLALPFVLLVLAAAPGRAQTAAPHSYVPPHGFVPDSATAVRIAVAVWIPIYGEQQIMSEQPFVARLKGGAWTVSGTLPPNSVGGTAVAKIAKRDGRILFVIHYQ